MAGEKTSSGIDDLNHHKRTKKNIKFFDLSNIKNILILCMFLTNFKYYHIDKQHLLAQNKS